jgi:hypothetical protein
MGCNVGQGVPVGVLVGVGVCADDCPIIKATNSKAKAVAIKTLLLILPPNLEPLC